MLARSFFGACVIKTSVDRVSVDTLGRYVDQQSADRPTEYRPICPSTYRPTVGRHIGRECRPTEVFITHDPSFQQTRQRFRPLRYLHMICIGKIKSTSKKVLFKTHLCAIISKICMRNLPSPFPRAPDSSWIS